MQYANLGRTGLKVSRICLGTMTFGNPGWREWVMPEKDSTPYFERAYELGINFFDTADMYSLGVSEEVTGRALKALAPRDEFIVATKVFNAMSDKPNDRGLSRKHILQACDDSLRRLGMDYIDLYQIHRFDYETPVEETLDALDTLVRQGKVRYLGASSMYAWQFMKMLGLQDKLGLHKFVSMQPQVNLVYREEEREMLPLCLSEGVGVIPWSPLARGFLTRPERDTTRARTDSFRHMLYPEESDTLVAQRLHDVAAERGAPPAQVALAWLLSKPGITAPIIGVSRPGQIEDAVAAVELKLSEEEIRRLEEPYVPHPVRDHA